MYFTLQNYNRLWSIFLRYLKILKLLTSTKHVLLSNCIYSFPYLFIYLFTKKWFSSNKNNLHCLLKTKIYLYIKKTTIFFSEDNLFMSILILHHKIIFKNLTLTWMTLSVKRRRGKKKDFPVNSHQPLTLLWLKCKV